MLDKKMKARSGFPFPIFLSTIFLWRSSDRLSLMNGGGRLVAETADSGKTRTTGPTANQQAVDQRRAVLQRRPP